MLSDEVLKIYLRSSVALKLGLGLANEVGIVDADYHDNSDNEGHIQVLLLNRTDRPVSVEKGQRIAQGMFQKYLVADDDSASGEREGGFGSTGR
jgi:dUTP pyrophosphatase